MCTLCKISPREKRTPSESLLKSWRGRVIPAKYLLLSVKQLEKEPEISLSEQ